MYIHYYRFESVEEHGNNFSPLFKVYWLFARTWRQMLIQALVNSLYTHIFHASIYLLFNIIMCAYVYQRCGSFPQTLSCTFKEQICRKNVSDVHNVACLTPYIRMQRPAQTARYAISFENLPIQFGINLTVQWQSSQLNAWINMEMAQSGDFLSKRLASSAQFHNRFSDHFEVIDSLAVNERDALVQPSSQRSQLLTCSSLADTFIEPFRYLFIQKLNKFDPRVRKNVNIFMRVGYVRCTYSIWMNQSSYYLVRLALIWFFFFTHG